MNNLEESRDSVSGSTIQITKKDPQDMENSKVLLVAVLFLAVCSLIALVLASVAISKDKDSQDINVNYPPSGTGASSGGAQRMSGGAASAAPNTNRIFTVATGHDYGPHEYLDKEGYIQGFSKDLTAAVCGAIGIDCRTVWDKTVNCWDSQAGEHSAGGIGLMSRWYDGCLAWDKSVNRMQTFAFGAAYLKQEESHFYVKKDSTFDPKDITGKKIGFIDGHVYDEKCIARQSDIKGSELEVDQIVHYAQTQQAVDALLAGTVHALTGDISVYGGVEEFKNGDIKEIGEFSCTLSGSTMMTRKDNDFLSFWNAGFAKIQSNGQFKKICDEANEKHGDKGPVNCV